MMYFITQWLHRHNFAKILHMINATDLKNGVTFLHEGKPYQVSKYSLIKMGRGGATVKVSVRNLESGSVLELSFSSNAKVEEVTTNKRKLQYLYKDDVNAYFMDDSFNQIEVPLKFIKQQLPYVKEGSSVDVLFWENRPLSVELPSKVTLAVVETDPGVKGNSASNIYKSAKLENGISVRVPLFVKTGERIVVDTRTGDYVSRG
jgi:elongation factor P